MSSSLVLGTINRFRIISKPVLFFLIVIRLFFLVPVSPPFERLTHGFVVVSVGNAIGPANAVFVHLFEYPLRLVARRAALCFGHWLEERIHSTRVISITN